MGIKNALKMNVLWLEILIIVMGIYLGRMEMAWFVV